MTHAAPLLVVEHLGIRLAAPNPGSQVPRLQVPGLQVLEDVSFAVQPGETLGLAGDSGAGKSMLALAIMGLLPTAAQVTGGRILFDGRDVLGLPPEERRRLRGRHMAMIFQNPRQALNPIRSAGRQLADVLRAHDPAAGRREVRRRSGELLEMVGLAPAGAHLSRYPFELSGGQCQRLMIALALAGGPRLLIADEATSGLDVTTQAAVMDLLAGLARRAGMATLFISHDLALLAQRCRQVAFLHDGRVVEQVPAGRLAQRATHPASRRLVAATPRFGMRPGGSGQGEAPPPPADAPPLLEVAGLGKGFETRAFPWDRGFPVRRRVRAVDDVSFAIRPGEALGLVGESGSGKSTVCMLAARLIDPDTGDIRLDGRDIAATPARRAARADWRGDVQMVFQDPAGSFNPASTVAEIVGAPLRDLAGIGDPAERLARVRQALGQAGLDPGTFLHRRPHQLSGGQAARVGIARAIATGPRLLILDEPTSALDVSVQAEVLALLDRLRRDRGIGCLFVSHNLQVVGMMCQRIVVMRDGRIVDQGPADALLARPGHPYTRALIDAVPAW